MGIYRTPVEVEGGIYAKGTRVTESKGFIFLSGSVGINPQGQIPATIGEQTKLSLENIKSRLEEHGGSLENILFVRYYVKGDFPNGIIDDPRLKDAWKALHKFWKANCPEFLVDNNPPASTLVGVTSLARPEFLIEIEVFAAVF